MKSPILLEIAKGISFSSSSGYIIGSLIALMILGYLIFTLIKPEKF